MENISIPKSIKTLESGTFFGCDRLKKTNLQNGLTKIDSSVFSYCKLLEEINIPDTVTYIGNSCFSNCKNIKEMTIPENVKHIGEDAFRYSGVDKVYFIETNGWLLCQDAATPGKEVDPSILADPQKAAEYLKENCYEKYLERK